MSVSRLSNVSANRLTIKDHDFYAGLANAVLATKGKASNHDLVPGEDSVLHFVLGFLETCNKTSLIDECNLAIETMQQKASIGNNEYRKAAHKIAYSVVAKRMAEYAQQKEYTNTSGPVNIKSASAGDGIELKTTLGREDGPPPALLYLQVDVSVAIAGISSNKAHQIHIDSSDLRMMAECILFKSILHN